MDNIHSTLDPDGTTWCEECEEFIHPDDPCDCEPEVDLDASRAFLQRLNPDIDIPEES